MPTTKKPSRTKSPRKAPAARGRAHDVPSVLRTLERAGSKSVRDGMGRYGIVAPKAFGVPMAKLRAIGKAIGVDHDLARALWDTGWYEARLLVAFVADPALLTPRQMDAWCADFDNWAVCDTLCFALFDRSPHALGRVAAWAKRKDEFGKRAAFALLATLALHRRGTDGDLAARLPLVEAHATDGRNFVKKAVSWALRAIGERSAELHAAASAVARGLAASGDASARWVGKDALRALASAATKKRILASAARTAKRK